MNFIRLHTPPKGTRTRATPKQRFLFDRSYQRYAKTKDGEYLRKAIVKLTPEIGRVGSVRFIETELFDRG